MITQRVHSKQNFGMAVHISPKITSHNERNLLTRGLAKTALINDVFVNSGNKIVGFSFWPFRIKTEPVYKVKVVKLQDFGKSIKFFSAFVLPKKDASLSTLDREGSYHSFVAETKRVQAAFEALARFRSGR